MRTQIQNLFLALASMGLLAMPAAAQTFTILHSFAGLDFSTYTNTDGGKLFSGLVLSGNTLYGTTAIGGISGNGTVFKVNTDGTGFTNIYNFSGPSMPDADYGPITNSDGALPWKAGLILSGNTLFGTTTEGGTFGDGTIFAINTDGTGFTNLYNISGLNDGGYIDAALVLSGNTLYGTTPDGGSSDNGSVFAINTDGTGFTNLYEFTGGSDGATPQAGLILSGNTLYGTASYGGTFGSGTIFAINTDGTGFTNLYSFTAPNHSTNADGASPIVRLTLSGNTLYGATIQGGSWGYGSVFAVNTDGTGFTNLYSFTGGNDGDDPTRLILSGNTLYGATSSGGSSSKGSVFAINTDGTGFTNLYSFIGGSEGYDPLGGVVLLGDTLYGTTWGGGNNGGSDAGSGIVFSFSLESVNAPLLNIILSGANVILSWPTNATGFTLQSTTNLAPPVVWSTVSGQNAVTNPISSGQMFFRLSQ